MTIEADFSIEPKDSFIYSVGNSEAWNEQRLISMQHIAALMAVVELFPERFEVGFVHSVATSLFNADDNSL